MFAVSQKRQEIIRCFFEIDVEIPISTLAKHRTRVIPFHICIVGGSVVQKISLSRSTTLCIDRFIKNSFLLMKCL